jgi:hypothetical protein
MDSKEVSAMRTPQELLDIELHRTTTDPMRPEVIPPITGGGKRPFILTGILILLAAIVGGGLTYAWRRADIRDLDRSLATTIAERDEAREEAATLTDRVERLQGRLTSAGTRADEVGRELSAVKAELLSMVGPALPDGRHFGRLYAVGTTQAPPRLVIDIEQWFTDQAAIDAAIEDGITVDPGINGYYIRNENARWRTIEIDPAATVSLTTYPFADPSDPTIVSLKRFGEVFYSYDGRFLQDSPYWITVKGGRVVAIEEQFIP